MLFRSALRGLQSRSHWAQLTFLENLRAVYLDQPKVGIFVLFAVAHFGQLAVQDNRRDRGGIGLLSTWWFS